LHIFIEMTAKIGQIHLLQNIIYSINEKFLENDQEGLKSEMKKYETTISQSSWIGEKNLEYAKEAYKKALEGKLK